LSAAARGDRAGPENAGLRSFEKKGSGAMDVSEIEAGKGRIHDFIVEIMTRLHANPNQVVLKWETPEPILNEHLIKLSNKSHRLRIFKGTQSVAINVYQSDIVNATLDSSAVLRYERVVTEALAELCGAGMCREKQAMNIRLFYFQGCPHFRGAEAILRAVLAEVGSREKPELIAIHNIEEARLQAFYGSPTIQVDGKDIEELPSDLKPSMSCRVYRSRDGLRGVPSRELLVAALTRTGRAGPGITEVS
jgi:hypothetical protein